MFFRRTKLDFLPSKPSIHFISFIITAGCPIEGTSFHEAGGIITRLRQYSYSSRFKTGVWDDGESRRGFFFLLLFTVFQIAIAAYCNYDQLYVHWLLRLSG